jgi:hypothetical protein
MHSKLMSSRLESKSQVDTPVRLEQRIHLETRKQFISRRCAILMDLSWQQVFKTRWLMKDKQCTFCRPPENELAVASFQNWGGHKESFQNWGGHTE